MIIKRLFDISCSFLGLLLMSPVLVPVMLVVWLQDFCSPFYVALRVGKGGRPFRMIKLRSMVVGADKSGVDSTAADDKRVTWIGGFVRRYKLDEFSQLLNVFMGQMSFVGPRPQVQRDVDLYTEEERRLLEVRPGITDFASIVFSDEGDILEGSQDPDLKYNQIIRPWKSRLALLYVDGRGLFLDIRLILLTATAIVSRSRALNGIVNILEHLGAEAQLIEVARRDKELEPYPPPGAKDIVQNRDVPSV